MDGCKMNGLPPLPYAKPIVWLRETEHAHESQKSRLDRLLITLYEEETHIGETFDSRYTGVGTNAAIDRYELEQMFESLATSGLLERKRDGVYIITGVGRERAEQLKSNKPLIAEEMLGVQREILGESIEQSKQLRDMNLQLREQLGLVNQSLNFISKSMGANFQRIERQQILGNEKLSEIYEIINVQDEGKFKKFIEVNGISSLRLIMQVISFIASGS